MALLDEDESRRTVLCTRLQQLGHECFTFSRASDFILALSGGRRFGLLLSVPQDEAPFDSLRVACRVLGMPVLMVVPCGQWGRLSSKGASLAPCCTLGANLSQMVDEELDWLVSALIHRASGGSAVARPDNVEVWGDYQFQAESRCVLLNGNPVTLQPREFSLALQLFRNVGRVVERDWLLTAMNQRKGTRALDVCVSSLRRKLQLNGEHGLVLRAVYRKGYQLVEVLNSASSGAAAGRGYHDEEPST